MKYPPPLFASPLAVTVSGETKPRAPKVGFTESLNRPPPLRAVGGEQLRLARGRSSSGAVGVEERVRQLEVAGG